MLRPFRLETLMLVATILLPSTALAAGLVGEDAADFTLNDTEGVSHTLSAYRGNVVFLSFIGFG